MKKISIGGQALIEGIMMKSPTKTAVAVRKPDGEIDITYIKEKHIKDKLPFLGWPVLRGVVNFIESMLLGYKALMLSADKSGLTELEEQEEAAKKQAKLEKLTDRYEEKTHKPRKIRVFVCGGYRNSPYIYCAAYKSAVRKRG